MTTRVLGSSKQVKGIIYTRDGISINDCSLIQFPIVNAETNRAVLLTNDHDVRAERTFRVSDSTYI